MRLILLKLGFLLTCSCWQHPTVARSTTSLLKKEDTRESTLKAKLLSFVTRRWIIQMQNKDLLKVNEYSVEAQENRVRLIAHDFQYNKKSLPILQLQHLDVELLNFHRFILSKGKKGGIVATISARASDLDASELWRRLLLDQIAPKLGIIGPTTARTSFRNHRISIIYGQDIAKVSFKIETTNDGRLIFREPDISLATNGKTDFPFFYEVLAEIVLSTVFLDASAALKVKKIQFLDDSLIATVISSSPQDVWKNLKKRNNVPWPILSAFIPRDLRPTLTIPHRRLPWLLAPTNSAPRFVLIAFFILGLLIQVTSIPEELFILLRTTNLGFTMKNLFFQLFSSLTTVFGIIKSFILKSPQFLFTQISTILISFIPGRRRIHSHQTNFNNNNDIPWWSPRRWPFGKKKRQVPPSSTYQPLILNLPSHSQSSWLEQWATANHIDPAHIFRPHSAKLF